MMYHKSSALNIEPDGSVYIADGQTRCFAFSSVPALCDFIEQARAKDTNTGIGNAAWQHMIGLEKRIQRIESALAKSIL